ncbi:MAG: lysophospholipid acyltransferase family protein [Eubacteriales bacterium]|nr:lysophospholipid acyltransferase family protein [Eubacteriales bacterium]
MFIGGSKKLVVENIKKAVEEQRFHEKVEVGDPDLPEAEKAKLVERFLKIHRTPAYAFNNWLARCVTDTVSRVENRKTEYVGLENIRGIPTGAIVTSNHFNPLENTAVRQAMKKVGKRRLYVVCQESNYAMKGLVGFLMNYMDTIPIWKSDREYMKHEFENLLGGLLKKKQFVLVYPEQEMWFNYRKPRPPKRGAYYYAAKYQVPVISCFVEIRTAPKKENEEFYKTRYIVHILPVIYPDAALSVRDDSLRMMELDYEQKKKAYERAYGKELRYTFEKTDIAGWIGTEEGRQ